MDASHVEAERRLRKTLKIAGTLLALVTAWTIYLLTPSTEAVRVRNAFLLEPVAESAADFAWRPDNVPASFRQETRPAPASIHQGVSELLKAAPTSDWKRALMLSEHLTKGARGGGAIQSELGESYSLIVKQGRGYCADFTKVYLAMAHEAGIPARQWAFAFDGFGGHGHALIEIFDRAEGRWMMIDVFNNIYAVEESTGRVLGALEFREFILGKRGGVVIRKAGAGRLGYPIEAKLLDYYRRGADQWYLWWANDVVTYNDHPALGKARLLGNSVEKLVATALGVHPTIKVLRTDSNADEIDALAGLRRQVTWAGGLIVPLGLFFLVTLVRWWRSRRRAAA